MTSVCKLFLIRRYKVVYHEGMTTHSNAHKLSDYGCPLCRADTTDVRIAILLLLPFASASFAAITFLVLPSIARLQPSCTRGGARSPRRPRGPETVHRARIERASVLLLAILRQTRLSSRGVL